MAYLVLLTFVLALPLLTQPAFAIDGCKLRADNDGTLYFSAKNINVVNGRVLTYHWRRLDGSSGRVFFNQETCLTGQTVGESGIANGRARKCTFGPEGSLRRIVPPDTCILTVAQDASNPTSAVPNDSCTAYLKGCTPGSRPVCPPDTDRFGSFCIDDRLQEPSTLLAAQAFCHERGRTVCSWQALSQCDQLNFGSCGAHTDGPRSAPLWTTDTAAEGGDNLFNRILAYEASDVGSNNADELNDDVDEASFFCCQPISGPLDPLAP